MFLLAERAFEVSPDQGVKGEVPVLPEEEQLGGEDEELVADVKIGNLLLGLVEIIKFERNKILELDLVGDPSLCPWSVHHTLVK